MAAPQLVSPGVVHFLRLSPAATRPAGDLQLDVGLSHEVDNVTAPWRPNPVSLATSQPTSPAQTLSFQLQNTALPISLRIGLTDWLEVGAGVNGFSRTAERFGGSSTPTLVANSLAPSWNVLPRIGGHVALGLHGAASALSLSLGGYFPVNDAYDIRTTTVAIQGATAVGRTLLVRGFLLGESDSFPSTAALLASTAASFNGFGIGAGAGLRWLYLFGALGIDFSVSRGSGSTGYSLSPVFDVFTGESAMVYLGGTYSHSSRSAADYLGGTDTSTIESFTVDLGVNFEPMH